jgi:aldehyde:ferredoxin oxidoreductase
MVIGPAGENLVSTPSSSPRTAATPLGHVRRHGSKNLKGIVARGNRKIELHDPEAFKTLIKQWIRHAEGAPRDGGFRPPVRTSGFLKSISDHNALPTKNFSSGTFKDAHMLSGQTLAETRLVKNAGCQSCPIRCARVVNLDGREIKGPEYEVLCLLGSNLLINDMDAIIRWNSELDLLGLDTLSTGPGLGFGAALNEKGLWKNGIELGGRTTSLQSSGPSPPARASGTNWRRASAPCRRIRGEDFAPHSKGMEMAAYEPRGAVGTASLRDSNRGASTWTADT